MTKKVFVGFISSLIGLASFVVAFNMFYDSWFPYYYEEYLMHFFLAGVALILVAPLLFAAIEIIFGKKRSSSGYWGAYYFALVRVNIFVFIVCVSTTVYMLSRGQIMVGSSPPVFYQVVPVTK